MSASNDDWETQVANLWQTLDDNSDPGAFVSAMDVLAADRPADGAALFERAAARDSTGGSDTAVPLYRSALAIGLTGERHRRAIIQMASSLRNLGDAEQSVALLTAERARTSDHLDDAVSAVLALALADTNREREAVSVAVLALARHLPRYQRSMANYARLLIDPDAAS